jgi:hypothetical protein
MNATILCRRNCNVNWWIRRSERERMQRFFEIVFCEIWLAFRRFFLFERFFDGSSVVRHQVSGSVQLLRSGAVGLQEGRLKVSERLEDFRGVAIDLSRVPTIAYLVEKLQ